MKYPQCDKSGYAGTWWDTAGWKTATLLQLLKRAAIRFFAYPGRARACLEAKHKTQFDGLSTSVLHAAEQYTFGRDKGKSGSGSLPATPTSSAAQQPAAPIPATPPPPGTGAGMSMPARTVNVNQPESEQP